MIFGREWRLYPHSVGFEVHTPKAIYTTDSGRAVVITVECARDRALTSNELRISLNVNPVSRGDLGLALKAELSRRAEPVVYVRGDDCVTVGDVMGVIDIGRSAWYGVPIVLLTPGLVKTLKGARTVVRP
jgi:biopolymer transport protein ExbD